MGFVWKQRGLCLIGKATSPQDVCACDYHPRLKMNELLSLLLHRDMGLVFRCAPCEWKTPNTTLYILKTSLNGGEWDCLGQPPLALTHKGRPWLGGQQWVRGWSSREYLMTKRLRTPLYATVWLMNAAASQTGLHPALWGHHLPSCSHVEQLRLISKGKCILQHMDRLRPLKRNLRVTWTFFIKPVRCAVVCGYWSGALCLVCWLRVYLQLLLLEMDPSSDLDSADPIKRCE